VLFIFHPVQICARDLRVNTNIIFYAYYISDGVLERVDNVKRGRGRPKLTWDESVKRDLKDWNVSKEIALDRSAWRLAINVPEL